jgi:hypothetical protein
MVDVAAVAAFDGTVPTRWTCPRCDREFARERQSHVCVPGCTVDDTFAGRPAWMREVYDRIVADLRELGELHEDAVKVGVFLKCERKLAEIRPRSRDLLVWIYLPFVVDEALVQGRSGDRVLHRIALRELTDEVREWFVAAYDLAARPT